MSETETELVQFLTENVNLLTTEEVALLASVGVTIDKNGNLTIYGKGKA